MSIKELIIEAVSAATFFIMLGLMALLIFMGGD